MRHAIAACMLVMTPLPVLAQSNPFLPPSNGLSREQIAQIVRAEIARNGGTAPGAPSTPGAPGAPGAPSAPRPSTPPTPQPGVSGIPNQPAGMVPPPGGTTGSVSVTAGRPDRPDPVADLLREGGQFVGCVGATPLFKDRLGRRAYFTTRELMISHEARRFARC